MRSEPIAMLLAMGFVSVAHADELPPAPSRPPDAKADIATHEGAGPEEPPPDPPSWAPRTDDPRYAFDPPVKEKGDYLHDGLFVRLSVGPTYLSGSYTAFSNNLGRAWTSDFDAFGTAVEAALGGSPFDGFTLATRIGVLLLPAPQLESALEGAEVDLHAIVSPIIGGLVDYYVLPEHGLHFFATMGMNIFELDDDGNRLSYNEMVVWLLGGGLGYEAWLSQNWSLGAQLRVEAGLYDGGAADRLDFVSPTFQLTFTYH